MLVEDNRVAADLVLDVFLSHGSMVGAPCAA
jgi:hypothetical protein